MMTALRRNKCHVKLVLFTVFNIYIAMVLYFTLLLYQSLIVMKLFNPRLMSNGFAAGKESYLIPSSR